MNVIVKLFATLRDGRFNIESKRFGAQATVRDVLSELKIPNSDVALILVNGRHVELDYVLSDGETLALFPPVGGG